MLLGFRSRHKFQVGQNRFHKPEPDTGYNLRNPPSDDYCQSTLGLEDNYQTGLPSVAILIMGKKRSKSFYLRPLGFNTVQGLIKRQVADDYSVSILVFS